MALRGHELLHQGEEDMGFKGFGEMGRHPHPVPFGFVIGRKTTREEHDRYMAAPGTVPEPLTELEAVHPRHGGVGQYDIGLPYLGFAQAIQGITRDHDLKVLLGKGGLDDGLHGETVFN